MSDEGKTVDGSEPLDALHAQVERLFTPLLALAKGDDMIELDELTRTLHVRVEGWFAEVEAQVDATLAGDPAVIDAVKGDHDGAREIFGEMRTLVEDARDDRPVDREHLLASMQAVQMALQDQMQREREKVWPRLRGGK
ncbi:MAG: hemerythrin domain-containing protein [bacterium]